MKSQEKDFPIQAFQLENSALASSGLRIDQTTNAKNISLMNNTILTMILFIYNFKDIIVDFTAQCRRPRIF